MKAVIIGGGIAGLTLGVFLRKKNIEVVINERSAGMPLKGHAFLMHDDGLSILNELGGDNQTFFRGSVVDTFNLSRPEGEEIKYLHLNSWQCFKRCDLIRYLYSLFPNEQIKEGRVFSHFIYNNENVIAAVFLNGEIEYGDVFIGADGGNSKVRDAIFGKVNTTPVKVKEVVGVTYNEKVAKTHSSVFTKYQKRTEGLSFGFIPTSANEFVWFMQYDPSISDLNDSTPEELKSFCKTLLKDFPSIVNDVLKSNDFSTSYIWNTRDFDLLPSFHKKNVVLIGDAAHLVLPFVSAGTTNAIMDAKALAQNFSENINFEEAFQNFYDKRAKEVSEHIQLGRELQNLFLNPQLLDDDNIPVPLLASEKNINIVPERKPIQVLYFTDPVCSTCWIMQPVLRKLKLEYGNYLNIEYLMGGLLPSWENYKKGKINNPSDAAKHWEDVCVSNEMPLDGDVWIEDPLNSSYPPSIAFKAAQMQNGNKAILFLRRIQEMVFLEKKNIVKWEFLKKAAFEVGLDTARLLRDFEGKAQEFFKEDLKMAEQLGVTSFPTFFFSDSSNNHFSLKGYQSYEKFEEILLKLIPSEKKEEIDMNAEKLFTHFPTMTDKEFAFLSNIPRESATKVLTDLWVKGSIDKYESKNGINWKSNFRLQSGKSSKPIEKGVYSEGKTTGEYSENGELSIISASCQIVEEEQTDILKLETEFLKAIAICNNYGEELSKQIAAMIEKEDIKLAIPVQVRLKEWESVLIKINENQSAVKSSVLELEDLVCFRIILLFEKDAEKTAALMRNHFKLLNEYRTENSGLHYSSIHQIIELNDNWLSLPTLSNYKDIRSEIQIRTFTQHCCAEMYDIFRFKVEENMPKPLKKALDRISALLETVDFEFGRVFNELENYNQKVSGTSENDDLKINIADSKKIINLIDKYKEQALIDRKKYGGK